MLRTKKIAPIQTYHTKHNTECNNVFTLQSYVPTRTSFFKYLYHSGNIWSMIFYSQMLAQNELISNLMPATRDASSW